MTALRPAVLATATLLAGLAAQGQNPAPIPAGFDRSDRAVTGPVLSTTNAAGYTYVQIKDGTNDLWAACWETQVSVGQVVTVPAGYTMKGFRSPSLQREFAAIRFIPALGGVTNATAHDPAALPPGHPVADGTKPKTAPAPDVSPVAPPAGGHKIADVIARRQELVGKDIAVRGRVVKFTQQVMGINWLHLQDGSGATPAAGDITVTTDGVVELGQIVTARGKLSADRDFGYGYKYDLLIEKAQIER